MISSPHETMTATLASMQAVATDYDGTIAHDGVVPDSTIAALRDLSAAGLKLLLVTGRQMESLFEVFPHTGLFDCIVAENGALLYTPATNSYRELAPRPLPAFLDALRKRHIPIAVGRTVVATVEPYEHPVLSVIRELGLEWHLIFNKGNVMALPSGITKATGLVPALHDLGVRAEDTVGVGDAENDHAFLAMCGVAVAVANALPSLKDEAHVVTTAARGEGFNEFARRLLEVRGVRQGLNAAGTT